MLKMAYIDPATSGFLIQFLFVGLPALIITGLIIFFIVWAVIKIKKQSKQIEQLQNQQNTTNADETHNS